MLTQEIIRHKRDGATLSAEHINQFVKGLTLGTVSESQASALAMAVFFRGLSRDEMIALTCAMRDSGRVMTWQDLSLNGPVVDKHSTGGVGDNVSLMLAPMLAACGCYVPMISGRGLGHTGGTLDKLDSIKGYVTQPDDALFRKVVKEVGTAIIGQTDDLAPADKKLYAIRDVTATVESIPLIVASILSKKLSAGLEALVLDVKSGAGAFMPTEEKATDLAQTLCDIANAIGLKTSALLTDMEEPLASAAGNAVEVQNAVDYLANRKKDSRLHDVTIALGAELLLSTKRATTIGDATTQLEEALSSGRAAEIFDHMVVALGGPKDFINQAQSLLPKANIIKPVPAPSSGIITKIKTRDIGLAVITLGGGRRVVADQIDHSVGFTELAYRGKKIDQGEPLAFVHAKDEASALKATGELQRCFEIGDAPQVAPSIIKRISSQ